VIRSGGHSDIFGMAVVIKRFTICGSDAMNIGSSDFLDNDPRYQRSSESVKEMRHAGDEAMDFQLWAVAQAHSLAKLKTFASMAKSINEQQ
jgi:hypothetical protein